MNDVHPLGSRRDPRLPSELMIERLLAQELTPAEEAQVRAQLAGCPGGLELLQQKQDQWAAVSRADKVAMLRGIEDRLQKQGWKPRFLAWIERHRSLLAVPAMAMAALGLFVMVGGEPADPLRSKGGLRLGVYRERDGQVERAEPGDLFRPGDRVRVGTRLSRSAYVVVYGREAGGEIFPVYPNGSEGVTPDQPLPAGAYDPLPGAIELDGSLGEESFRLAVCERAVPIEQLREDEIGALERAECELVQFPIRKGR